MAFLIIAGQTIPVLMQEPTSSRGEVGRRGRAFDGSARSTVRARKEDWPIVTKYVLRATADTMVSALEGSPPLAASGDLTGSINVLVGGIRKRHRKFATGEHVQLSFLVQEA